LGNFKTLLFAKNKSPMISVLQLDSIEYRTALRLQEKLLALRKGGAISDVLVLLEHLPVITLGRNAKTKNIVASPDLLAQRGVEVFECDRGGDVTFHGPGQLVAYPIFDLRGFPSDSATRKTLGAVEYVRRLEEVLIRTCADFGVSAKRISGLTGVWTGEDARASTIGGEEAKIAALGVHISQGVTSHGVALNVNNDLSFFDLIVPCGIAFKGVTSMAEQLNREVPMQDIAYSFSRNFGVVFQSQMLWLDNLESLLGKDLDIPLKLPEELRKIHPDDGVAWA
jgi:lipoyl(octanoyl) transferase